MVTRTPIPAPPPADLETLSRRFHLPIADLSKISAHAVGLIPERWARRFHIVPVLATERDILIATADPLDVDCERTLAFATGRRVRLALATTAAIDERIEEAYRGDVSARESAPAVEVQHLTNADEGAPPTPEENSSSITHLVDELL